MKKKQAVVDRTESGPAHDQPLTPDEVAESDAAWQEYLAGRDEGEPLRKVRQDLLENSDD